MKHRKTVTRLSIVILLLAVLASWAGIFSSGGPGPYDVETVRGDTVTVYGRGIYKHMSADVAPQGIAQDYVTLLVGVPLLFVSLLLARRKSLRGRYLLAGTLGYFLVTYLFYLVMGMYNALFLVYVLLLSSSFFAFSLTLFSFDIRSLPEDFRPGVPVKTTGGFLIFSSIAIGLMWLGVVVPPLIEGSVIPDAVEHYTTLIVQGLDLALLLPLAFFSGILFMRRRAFGFLLAPVYLVFLSIMMTALTAKVIAMARLGQEVMPAIVVIPLFNLTAIVCSIAIFHHLRESTYE